MAWALVSFDFGHFSDLKPKHFGQIQKLIGIGRVLCWSWSKATAGWDKKPRPIQLFSRTRPQFSRSGGWRASSYADHIDQRSISRPPLPKWSYLNWIGFWIHHHHIHTYGKGSFFNYVYKTRWVGGTTRNVNGVQIFHYNLKEFLH